MKWKSNEEENCKLYFVQHSSNRTHGYNQYQYLYCNHSGKIGLRGKGMRHIKTQGSCKTGTSYIANMRVMTDSVTGAVKVDYCSTPTQHNVKLAHLPLPPDVKHNIAAKLHDGVRIESILDSIRDSVLDNTIGRRQLLSRQNILNIKNKLNIRSIMKHSNDHFSTSAWVEELQSQPQN